MAEEGRRVLSFFCGTSVGASALLFTNDELVVEGVSGDDPANFFTALEPTFFLLSLDLGKCLVKEDIPKVDPVLDRS